MPEAFSGEREDDESFLTCAYQLKAYLSLSDKRYPEMLKIIEEANIVPVLTDVNMFASLNPGNRLNCDQAHLLRMSADLLNLLMLLVKGKALNHQNAEMTTNGFRAYQRLVLRYLSPKFVRRISLLLKILHFPFESANFETSISAFEKLIQDFEAIRGGALDNELKYACLLVQTK